MKTMARPVIEQQQKRTELTSKTTFLSVVVFARGLAFGPFSATIVCAHISSPHAYPLSSLQLSPDNKAA